MKKSLLLVITIGMASFALGQHCPWDCSGMVLLEAGITKEKFYQLSPVLVDENKKEIVTIMYGTGLDTRDTSKFMSYEDFTEIRTKKINIHHWYRYDTFYHFAKDKYLVKFNHCEYYGKKLYLRFYDPYTRGLTYRYIEIPENKRIHLHNYSGLLNKDKTNELKKITEQFVLKVSCEEWKLRAADCK